MKKAAVLVVVIGVMFAICILAVVALNLMTQESRIAEHKIKRMRAFYAAQSGQIDAQEKLRRNFIARPTIGNPVNYQIDEFGKGILDYPANGYTIDIWVLAKGDMGDPDRPCPITAPSDFCIFSHVNDY
ncbi:MAG: hypothetical protein WCI77_10020 [Candidatus Omnitrophota bacterium]